MELYIERNMPSYSVSIWLYEDKGDYEMFYGYNGESMVQYSLKKTEPFALTMSPLLKLPVHLFESLTKAFADLASNKGIRPDNEHKIKGTLDAKESHLDDMRKIVFELLTQNSSIPQIVLASITQKTNGDSCK